MVVWYYAKGGERRGPMPWSEFRDAARAGAFGPDDLVWTPGYGAEWRKASTLETLFPPPKPAVRLLSSSSGTSVRSPKAAVTAWQQLYPPCFRATARSARSNLSICFLSF